jgi:hypothetical protein
MQQQAPVNKPAVNEPDLVGRLSELRHFSDMARDALIGSALTVGALALYSVLVVKSPFSELKRKAYDMVGIPYDTATMYIGDVGFSTYKKR